LSQAYEAEPGNNEALYLLAGAHLALLHYKQARALVAEFCARVPNYATAHYALGWIDEKLGQDGLAQSEFQACLKLEPSFQGAITELGEMALHSNRLDEAEGRFRRVLALNPGNAKVAVGLGDVLRKRGYIEAALKQYEAAARKDPNWSVPHYRLALLLSRKGDKTEGDSERKIAQSLAKKEVTEGSARLTILWPELAGEGQQALQAPAAISASE
jgi:tetratricopeptide (TPR) repeat protein